MSDRTQEAVIIDSEEHLRREVEEETALVQRSTGQGLSLARISLDVDKEVALQKIETFFESMQRIRQMAIARTDPTDWTLFRDAHGTVVGRIRHSGATKIRQLLGISTYNVRPVNPKTNAAEARITQDELGVVTAEVWLDAFCALTNDTVRDIRGCRRSDEDFIGRKISKQGVDYRDQKPNLEDLKQAARTAAETKAVTILGGMIAVPIEELLAAGINTDRCVRGHGFSKAERAAGAAGGEGGAGADAGGTISEAQRKRLFAISREAAEACGAKDPSETAKAAIQMVLDAHGIPDQKSIPRSSYDAVVAQTQKKIEDQAAKAAPGEGGSR